MNHNQKPIVSEAYKMLQKLMFSKSMTESSRRAIRVRLEPMLEDEERQYKRWQEEIKPKMNLTRQKQVEREFKKRIQGLKIVIHLLTPYWERVSDVPTFVVRKDKKP